MITDNISNKGKSSHVFLTLKTLAFLFLLVFAAFLVSCTDNGDDNLYDYIFPSVEEEQQDDMQSAYSLYRVVIPSDCSPKLYSAAELLCSNIREATDSKTELIYDFEDTTNNTGVCEIIIGDTERPESLRFLKGFRIADFGYRCFGDTIVLGGLRDDCSLSAIEKFTEDVVVYADKEYFCADGKEYIYRADYEIENITLNGFEICDYLLVYPNDDIKAYLAALALRDGFAEKTGYHLKVESDAEISNGRKAICVGPTRLCSADKIDCTAREAYILPYASGVAIAYDGDYGMRCALEHLFYDLLTPSDGEKSSKLDIFEILTVSIDTDSISIMSMYAEKSSYSTLEMNEMYGRVLDEYPDIIQLYDFPELFIEYLEKSFNGAYAKLKLGDGVYHFYKNSEFSAEMLFLYELDGTNVFRLKYSGIGSAGEFEFLDIVSASRSDISKAEKAAILVNEIANADKGKIIISASTFKGSADTAFSASLTSSDRVTDFTLPSSDKSIPVFISGDAFGNVECYDEQTSLAYICNVSLLLMKIMI